MKLLWIGKHETSGGGDEIYDRKILANLHGFEVDRLGVERQGGREAITALLSGVPHPRYKYMSNSVAEKVKARAAGADVVVVSLETLEGYAKVTSKPTVLIVHNVTGDGLRQIFPKNVVAWAAALQSRIWEKAIYNRRSLTIVTLSERDRDLVRRIAPQVAIEVAPPGCPPAASLDPGAGLVEEIFISGSYEWWPKRRDINGFAASYAASANSMVVRRDYALPDEAERALKPIDIVEEDFASGIRLGVIPDTFLAGFKLKATYYIAKNCICLSRADIRSEFAHIEDHQLFVRYLKDISDLQGIVAELKAIDREELRQRFERFKTLCLEEYSWKRSAAAIETAIIQAVGARRN